MPIPDSCHPQVVVALQKDGWTITGQQVHIPKPDLYVYMDIEAEKADQQAYIEVKCFPDANSTTEFYIAMGQYLVYREVLATEKPTYALYLAVPEAIFETLGATYRDTIQRNRVKIMVVNIETEVITQWIT